MKVIDKRAERNNDWDVGDVICYWNKPNEPLPKEIDCYTVKPCDDYSKRYIIYIYYRLEK